MPRLHQPRFLSGRILRPQTSASGARSLPNNAAIAVCNAVPSAVQCHASGFMSTAHHAGQRHPSYQQPKEELSPISEERGAPPGRICSRCCHPWSHRPRSLLHLQHSAILLFLQASHHAIYEAANRLPPWVPKSSSILKAKQSRGKAETGFEAIQGRMHDTHLHSRRPGCHLLCCRNPHPRRNPRRRPCRRCSPCWGSPCSSKCQKYQETRASCQATTPHVPHPWSMPEPARPGIAAIYASWAHHGPRQESSPAAVPLRSLHCSRTWTSGRCLRSCSKCHPRRRRRRLLLRLPLSLDSRLRRSRPRPGPPRPRRQHLGSPCARRNGHVSTPLAGSTHALHWFQHVG